MSACVEVSLSVVLLVSFHDLLELLSHKQKTAINSPVRCLLPWSYLALSIFTLIYLARVKKTTDDQHKTMARPRPCAAAEIQNCLPPVLQIYFCLRGYIAQDAWASTDALNAGSEGL